LYIITFYIIIPLKSYSALLKFKDRIYHKNAMKLDIKPESMQNVLDELMMRYRRMMITESGNAEKKARVIGNIFQKEIINMYFRSVII